MYVYNYYYIYYNFLAVWQSGHYMANYYIYIRLFVLAFRISIRSGSMPSEKGVLESPLH